MSVSDSKTRAYCAREERSGEFLRELELKRSAKAQLGNITCPCGLPRGKNHPICFSCWKALPEHIKNGLQSQVHETKRIAGEMAITFAAGRPKPGQVGKCESGQVGSPTVSLSHSPTFSPASPTPQPQEHRHD